MIRKPFFRYLIASLLILTLIGAGSMAAYRMGIAQGAGYDAIPFAEGKYENYDQMPHGGYGQTPRGGYGGMMFPGRFGHHGGFGFAGFGFLGMLFHIFLAILVFKLIFRFLFFPFGMRYRKKMRHPMHGHRGMWGWYDDEDWDDEDKEPTKDETKSDEE